MGQTTRASVLVLFALSLSTALWAQMASISGSVVDAEARYPLLGATVQVRLPLTLSPRPTSMDVSNSRMCRSAAALLVSFIGCEARVLGGSW